MARPTKEQVLAEVHSESLEEFGRASSSCHDERIQCKGDRRFAYVPGAQFEDQWAEQFENKPKLEINKTLGALLRLEGEYRSNRVMVNFRAKDGDPSKAYLADACDGLFRADYYDSRGEEAADNAFQEGSAGGLGGWRLRAEYEDDEDPENEHQRIRWEPIYDADTSLYFDADAKRMDKSDAKRAWLVYSMTVDAYKDAYDDDPATWPKDINTGYFDWTKANIVYLAEYYLKEEKRVTWSVYTFPDGSEERFEKSELDEDELLNIEARNGVWSRDIKKKRCRVRKYLMSGGKIIEDQGYIAGPNIPLIPFYARRAYVDDVERPAGVVRPAKDAQRMLNVLVSKGAEIAATSGTKVPVFYPEEINEHKNAWRDHPKEGYAFLLKDQVIGEDGNPIQVAREYYEPAEIPQAMAALLQVSDQYLGDIIGRPQDGAQLTSNISADAVEMIQSRIDQSQFIVISNFSKAMRRCGQVWLGMARELYVEDGRSMKTIGEMDNVSNIKLGTETLDEQTGELVDRYDMTKAAFDVDVDVGPSFASKRDAIVRTLSELRGQTQSPQDQQILSALIMMNVDTEGMGDIREYYRKQLVAMGVLPPNEEEKQAMEQQQANQQPGAQDQYLMAEAGKSQAEAQKTQMETMKLVQDIHGMFADMMKKLAEVDETYSNAAKLRTEAGLTADAPTPHEPDLVQPPMQPEPGMAG